MKIYIPLLLSLAVASSGHAATVVHFDELSGFNGTAPGAGQYFDGYGATATTGSWSSQGVTFNTGSFTGGWSYSNVDDTTTPGFTNQWASFTGTGFGGSGNYALANSLDPNTAFFNLPTAHVVESVQVANTTYSYLSMRDGDAFAKKFGGPSGSDPDFFSVTFTGFSDFNTGGIQTGSQELFLGDYRFTDNSQDFIRTNWTLLDLTSLGNARSVGISFDGSDIGSFGLNTPAYVAIDDLTISAVPEPSSLAVLGVMGAGLIARWRRRRGTAPKA